MKSKKTKQFIVKTGIILIVNFFVICTFYNNTRSAYLFDPGLSWKTIKTRHFWIHYHQGLEKVAQKMTQIAEKVHRELILKANWSPKLRTHIVLVDNTDIANGFAMHIPYNRVQIYISRPELNSTLSNFDDSLERIFTHEYTHILNLDTSKGFPGFLRKVLGRFPLLFGNTFVPIWVLEGNAVYNESSKPFVGRNNSMYTEMIMRTEVLENALKPISVACGYPREWPKGRVPYLYGGSFVQYLEEQYGKGNFAEYFHENGDNIIPFSDSIYFFIPPLYNKDAKDIYNKSFGTLWEEWQEEITGKYRQQIKKIREKGVTPYTVLSNPDDNATLPRYSRNGKDIYYISSSPYYGTRLIRQELSGKKNTLGLSRVHYPNGLALSRDNRVVTTDIEIYDNYSEYSEIYSFSNARGYTQHSEGLRAKHIDYSGVLNRYLFIINKNNTFSLVLSDPALKNKTYLIKESPVQIAFPKFSPDGKKILFTIKADGDRSDLALLTIADGSVKRLTNDRANDIEPAWSPDGEKAVFSSDSDGVYNIYEIDFSLQKIRQITNLLGGGFSPQLSPDGKQLLFCNYQKNGMAVAVTGYPRKSIREYKVSITTLPDNFFETKEPLNNNGTAKAFDYTVFNSILPAFYFPILPVFMTEQYGDDKYDSLIGVITAGSDTLFQHIYTFTAYTGIEQKRATLNINYMFARYNPNILISYYDDALQYGNDEYPWNSEQSLDRTLYRIASLSADFPFYYYDRTILLSASYNYGREFNDEYSPVTGKESNSEIISDIQTLFSFNNTKMYTYSVVPEDGRSIIAGTNFLHKKIGSDNTYYIAKARYTENLPFFFTNSTFKIDLRGGYSNNAVDDDTFSLGRFTRGSVGILNQDNFNFGLRGFPKDIREGNAIVNGSVEMTIPVLQYDFGISIFPLMFRDLWLTAFFDYGNVWNRKKELNSMQYSSGIELHSRFTLGYYLDITSYIGYAKALTSKGENQVYFAVSSILGGALKNKRNSLHHIKHRPVYQQ